MTKQQPPLQEQQVVDYLRHHPDFLLRHPYLLVDLQLQQQQQGLPNLALHQQRMLRDELDNLKQQVQDMVQYAKSNELVFKQLSQCQLAIMQCQALSDINHTLAERFATHPDIQACQLLPVSDELDDLITAKLAHHDHYLGRISPALAGLLFSDAEVGSVALYRVNAATKGEYILAFASNSAEHFSPQHDNMLIDAFIQTLTLKLAELA